MVHNDGPRDRILDAAEQVFGERGYRGGALNDVAVAAGYTRAGLLHHFPSKEALLLAVLERRDDRLQIDELGRRAGDLESLLRQVQEQVDQITQIKPLIRLGHIVEAEAASPDHPAHEWAAGRERRLRSMLQEVVEQTQAAGKLRADVEPALLAAVILAVEEGLEAQWLLDDSVDVAAGMSLMHELVRTLYTD